MGTVKKKARKAPWGNPMCCRQNKSSWIESMARMDGRRREDRRSLRRTNRQSLRRGIFEFVPYRKGLHFSSHPEW